MPRSASRAPSRPTRPAIARTLAFQARGQECGTGPTRALPRSRSTERLSDGHYFLWSAATTSTPGLRVGRRLRRGVDHQCEPPRRLLHRRRPAARVSLPLLDIFIDNGNIPAVRDAGLRRDRRHRPALQLPCPTSPAAATSMRAPRAARHGDRVRRRCRLHRARRRRPAATATARCSDAYARPRPPWCCRSRSSAASARTPPLPTHRGPTRSSATPVRRTPAPTPVTSTAEGSPTAETAARPPTPAPARSTEAPASRARR